MFFKRLYDYIFRTKWTVATAVTAAAVLLAIVQFGAIIYINLFALKHHIDSDFSINILKLMESVSPIKDGGEQILTSGSGKGFLGFITGWEIKLLGGDVFLFYSLKNILTSATIIFVVIQLFKRLDASMLASMLCINLLLCPYITANMNVQNDLGYYACMFVSAGYYGTRTLLELLILLNFIDLGKNKVRWPLIILSALYIFNYGMSTGLYIMLNVIAPVFVCCVVMAFIKNDAKRLISKQMIYAAACIVLLLCAKVFTKVSYDASAIDDSISLIGVRDMWKNICSVFYGFGTLIGAFSTGDGIAVLSLGGLQYMINFVILAVFIIAFFYYIARLVKKEEKALKYLPFFCVTAVVFLIHSLIAAPFSNESSVRGSRYLLPAMISGIFLVSFFIDDLKEKSLFKSCGIIVLTVCTLLSSGFSYKNYRDRRTPYELCQTMADKISEYDTPVVYSWGEAYAAGWLGTWAVSNNMRVFDREHVYKTLKYSHNSTAGFGDYNYYNDNAEWDGETLLMSMPQDFETLPGFISERYELVYTEPKSGLSLYYSDENCFDLDSSVKNGKNTELPYSFGVKCTGGHINEDGHFQTNAEEEGSWVGDAINVINETSVEKGVYNITVNYEVTSYASDGEPAVLRAMTGNWGNLLGEAGLDKGKTSVTIEGIKVPSDDFPLGYRIDIPKGTDMRLISVDIESAE